MPAALGQDLASLRKLVTALWPKVDTRPRLFGPDIAAFTGGTALPSIKYLNGSSYYDAFLENMPADTLQVRLGWHNTPLCGYE